ncbi:MAG: hypothetical protein KGI27_10630 [Thaumarchaeota archaeon]|nr:hypothetical protein [Nitrososphaerota archaeon]
MVRLVLVSSVLFLVVFSMIQVFADTGNVSVVAGKTFQVGYNANGVKVQDIETNPTYDELTVSVQVSSQNALLELTIPRDLLDSKQGNSDIPFITVIDGTLGNVMEKDPTDTTRTISIQLSPGNQQIEIIGTFVAIAGPHGSTQAVPSSNTVNSTSNIPQEHQSTPSAPEQKTPPKTITQPQESIPQENTTSPLNSSKNIVFNIPYLQNASINLSQTDLAVIGAIVLVVIIVIASVARRKPARVAKKI